MADDPRMAPETDAGFPSGKWTGFYTYYDPNPHRMDLFLEFHASQVSGDGMDDVGRFLIQGRYSCDTRQCSWAKRYVGQHTVTYHGVQSGKTIAGEWTLRSGGHTLRGGFRIWPSEYGDLTAEYFVEETAAPRPDEVQAVGQPHRSKA